MEKELATAVPLELWKDPQGDIILVYSERECSIYFGCWEEPGNPADYICRLKFQRALGVRSYPHEYHPFSLVGQKTCSDIYEVTDSKWHAERAAYWQHLTDRFYDKRRRPFSAKHFVIIGHDSYHEILAESFEQVKIFKNEVREERLKALLMNT